VAFCESLDLRFPHRDVAGERMAEHEPGTFTFDRVVGVDAVGASFHGCLSGSGVWRVRSSACRNGEPITRNRMCRLAYVQCGPWVTQSQNRTSFYWHCAPCFGILLLRSL